ncbi:hypothetical protein CNMCM5623_006164 [Aspergillus felis]|uniref:Rhamnogalacturonase A/B/Epimerase-like pectate lyase domain-containing protein n=1 Tax=Aspergillus felis TaxID=1287682 RepID=A0A8H6V4W0_9EURO|nr:hypothetical protein CNMCM5623_006164 [Aspergillus felis]
MPFAPSGYKFYRNARDYGATGDGTTDDTAAINRAVSDGNRCGKDCGSTSILGALVYFPAIPMTCQRSRDLATSLQNIYFKMPVSTASQTTTAVGVFMENGSGGFAIVPKFEGFLGSCV